MAIEDGKKLSIEDSGNHGEVSTSSGKVIPVGVVVRVRPLVKRKQDEFFSPSLEVSPDHPQITIRGSEPSSNKVFTYDHVFPPDATQEEIYRRAVSKLLFNLFKGFNVTILAYGQTGSGKTYSMGTNYVSGDSEEDMGIIPRAVIDMFRMIQEKQAENEYIVKVSFVELYSENLYDLLQCGARDENSLEIRETPQGGIKIQGVTEVTVSTLAETMKCLEKGSMNRVTGATAMNAHSSRSHAILCITLEQRKKLQNDDVVCSKFTLVDLAGSERAKKTKAEGQRFKEGVAINSSLLSLGQVIKILATGKEQFVPYRACKLTRLLQDSLGGNSHTVMLACVSPADDSLEETLSTLRYADNARKIKNKPVVNNDPRAAEMTRLRQQIHELQVQLLTSKASGTMPASHTDREVADLLEQNRQLKEENESLAQKLQFCVEVNTNMAEKALMAEMSRERLKQRLQELQAQTGDTIDNINKTLNASTTDPASSSLIAGPLSFVKELQKKVMDMQSEQQKSEKAMVQHELTYHNAGTDTSFTGGGNNTSTGDVEDYTNDASAARGAGAGDGGGGDGDTSATDKTDCDAEDGSGPASAEATPRKFGVEYTLRQCKLNDQLTSLNRALAQKEQLMGQMVDNDEHIQAMRASYEVAIRELESKIAAVTKEKEELQEQLDKTPKTAANKLAEQRRKRLQELTAQVDGLKHKVLEKNKMLKQKESTDKKLTVLSNEIASMKQTRVKLIRQMKEDSEKFRRWKAHSDKEIAKLKEQERRKEFQLVRMERLNTKQQDVLKRKIEEGAAINKRLKDALAVQKACAAKRANSRGDGTGGCALSKVKSWLDGELDVVAVRIQAKHSLHALRHDRKTIADQLQKVTRSLKVDDLSEDYAADLRKKSQELETELQLRTAQITDIQQKCLDDGDDAASESLNRKRFESVQSMVEAKAALGYLFETAAQHKADSSTYKQEIKDVQNQYQELVHGLEETEAELEKLKAQHKQELTKLEHEHQSTLMAYLQQLSSSDEAAEGADSVKKEGGQQEPAATVSLAEHQRVKERLSFQDAEIRRLSKLHDELQAKIDECDDLRQQLDVLANKKVSPRPSAVVVSSSTLPVPSGLPRPTLTAAAAPKKAKKVNIAVPTFDLDDDDDDSDLMDTDEEDMDDDKTTDPDWKKTPLFKRIHSMKRRQKMEAMNGSDEDKENNGDDDSRWRGGIKRGSDGVAKCGCTSDCTSRRCSCRKSGAACSVSCRCNAMKCANKVTPDCSLADQSSKASETVLNSTFDVGAQSADPTLTKKFRLSRLDGSSDLSLQSTAATDGSGHSSAASVTANNLDGTFLMPRPPLVKVDSPDMF